VGLCNLTFWTPVTGLNGLYIPFSETTPKIQITFREHSYGNDENPSH
jgi:hypothetical protein